MLRETTSKYGEWYFIVLGILAIVVTVWSPAGIYGFVVRKTNFFLFPLQRKVRLASAAEEPQTVAAESGGASV